MSKSTTVEKNGRFYKKENGEILTENELLKEWLVIANEQLDDYKSRIEKAVEYNQQVIKDTKDFYRPTENIIYSGDTLIDIAEHNVNILNGDSRE